MTTPGKLDPVEQYSAVTAVTWDTILLHLSSQLTYVDKPQIIRALTQNDPTIDELPPSDRAKVRRTVAFLNKGATSLETLNKVAQAAIANIPQPHRVLRSISATGARYEPYSYFEYTSVQWVVKSWSSGLQQRRVCAEQIYVYGYVSLPALREFHPDA